MSRETRIQTPVSRVVAAPTTWSGCTRRLLMGAAAGVLGIALVAGTPLASVYADDAPAAAADSAASPDSVMGAAERPAVLYGAGWGAPQDVNAGSSQGAALNLGVSLGSGTTAYAWNVTLDQADVYNKALKDVIALRQDALNDTRVKFDGMTVREYLKANGISEQDYLSPKWSNVLERIAIQRAVEANDARLAHTRPNGEDCFTAEVGGDGSSSEILAWGGRDISAGIRMWASEKDDYIKQVNGEAHDQTGHYVTLISPGVTYYGFAQFASTFSGEGAGSRWLRNKDETPTKIVGKKLTVAVNVSDDKLAQGATFAVTDKIAVGKPNAVRALLNYMSTAYELRGTWTSSNPSILQVTDAVTGKFLPKAAGRATLTFTSATGRSYAVTFDVTFSDVATNYWAYTQGWLQYVTATGLMGGYNGAFAPEGDLTRGQVAAVLYRIANPGSDATTNEAHYGKDTGFKDGGRERYYYAAVKWLKAQGISTGDKDPATGASLNTFRPDDPITRQELAAMVYRFAQKMGAKIEAADAGKLAQFRDGGGVLPYAREAMAWCVANGVITGGQGDAAGLVMPGQNATRAQAAKIFTVVHRDVLKK